MRFSPELEREVWRMVQVAPADHIVFPADEYRHGRVVIYRDNLAKTLHRYLWEGAFGQLPANVYLKRTCREARCVNPHHYEQTQRTQPVLTQCRNGHRYSEGNTRIDGRGIRHCRKCDRDRAARKRGGRPAPKPGMCRKGLHKMVDGNIYVVVDRDGTEHRRCAECKRKYERERRAA